MLLAESRCGLSNFSCLSCFVSRTECLTCRAYLFETILFQKLCESNWRYYASCQLNWCNTEPWFEDWVCDHSFNGMSTVFQLMWYRQYPKTFAGWDRHSTAVVAQRCFQHWRGAWRCTSHHRSSVFLLNSFDLMFHLGPAELIMIFSENIVFRVSAVAHLVRWWPSVCRCRVMKGVVCAEKVCEVILHFDWRLCLHALFVYTCRFIWKLLEYIVAWVLKCCYVFICIKFGFINPFVAENDIVGIGC